METPDKKPETTDRFVERVLLEMSSRSESDLRRIRDGIDQLLAEKGVAGNTGDTSRTGQAEASAPSSEPVVSEKPEELNQFGLPSSWASRISLQGLEKIRESLNRTGSTNGAVVQAALRGFLTYIRSEYQKFRGDDAPFDMSSDVRSNTQAELSHLRLSQEQRLEYLQQQYPRGLAILGTSQYIKWDVVAPFELWAMQRHGQPFTTLNRRGGCAPKEIIAIVYGIYSSELRDYSDEMLMKFLKDNEFLAD